jgi:F-type H+-transporting ATPase subunit beta
MDVERPRPAQRRSWTSVVYGGVGERSREGTELLRDFEHDRENKVFLFAQMDSPAGARFRVAASAVTMAEYFRDTAPTDGERNNVLLCIDNVYRFIQAGSELSTMLGRMPSEVGYQATLDKEIGELLERMCSTHGGDLTSLMCIYVPADDGTDPGVLALHGHLDSKIFLDRDLRNSQHFPAVNVLNSNCWRFPTNEHAAIARAAKKLIALYTEANKLRVMLGSPDDLQPEYRDAYERGMRLYNYFNQPSPGYPLLENTLRDVWLIMYGKALATPEGWKQYPAGWFARIDTLDAPGARPELKRLLDEPINEDLFDRKDLLWIHV